MYNLPSLIKFQKPIIKFAIAAILILVFIFALSLAIYKYADKYNPAENPDVAPQPPKTMEEIIDSLTAPVSGEEQPPPVSTDVLDSLTAPVKTEGDSTIDSKTSKAAEPAPPPVSKEIIDSLTAPAGK
ncbi:hypothetical protein KKA96_03035 [Patescibacteria group bacterium]|nr:hypothetical protein [Patescibacteria group bacterium]